MSKQITLAKTGFDGAAVALISVGVGLITANIDDTNKIVIGLALVGFGLITFIVRHTLNESWGKPKPEPEEKPKPKPEPEEKPKPKKKKPAKEEPKEANIE